MSGLRPLLLVDDDALRASLVEQILSQGAFRPDEAESRAEPKAKLAQADARHDIILLSSLLTVTGGYLLKALAGPTIAA
jgi:PleD family two-component response regulator